MGVFWMKLTDTKVRNAKPAQKDFRVPDGGGLCLFVSKAGGKLWQYRYRFDSKGKLMALGSYPDVSLSEAREKHLAARKLLADGVDPMEQRKADRLASKVASEYSFQNIVEKWHKHWSTGRNTRYADTVKRRLAADVFPALGSSPVTEIEAPAIVKMVKAIEKRGAHDLAKRALETTGQVFRYAIAHGYCTRNPAAEIKPADILKTVPKENYARVDAKELPDLLRSIETYQGKPVTRLAIKLLAHTFVRTGELIGARWDEFDIEGKRWNIPKERMKMRTPHVVPLSFQALEVIQLLHSVTGKGALLFPGDLEADKPMSNNTILKALERMGYKGRMTAHGFRGLASTILHERGFPHDHIELQLAHAPRNAVSAAYNHALYLAPRAKMMQSWSDYLEAEQARQGVADALWSSLEGRLCPSGSPKQPSSLAVY